MRLNLSILAMCAVTALAAPAFADTILSDDFQDGEADGWVARGDGDLRLTTYAGNVSMRLAKKAEGLTAFPTTGFEGVTVSVGFAADGLDGREACIAEATADGGATWAEIFRIGDGLDDALTIHRGNATPPAIANATKVIVRLRIDADGDDEFCWADEVVVTGQRKGGGSSDAGGARTLLAKDFLAGSELLAKPVSMDAFARPKDASAPTNTFSGQMTFAVTPKESGFKALRDTLDYQSLPNDSYKRPPPFDMSFVQSGDRLIPTRRGVVVSGTRDWDWIVEVGTVWNEVSDSGMTRAAVPFSLQEVNANCTHNGIMTFLFDKSGAISRIAYQIVQETCAYFKFDAWGTAAARYEPGTVANAPALMAAFEQEMKSRLPTKPIAAIKAAYPALDTAAFGAAADVSPENMTVYGVVIDGVHYVGGCQTRYGAHPYCDAIDLPSYSTAKSVFAGLALMRLEQLYPGAKSALIVDYVPECAAAGDWDGVTFDNALDMATGRYDSAAQEADENAATSEPFFIKATHAEKIKIACTRYPRKDPPGKTWAYHTSDTYLLGAAMQAYWRKTSGAGGDVFEDVVVTPIFRALGLSPTTYQTRRTSDDVKQPFTGWGLTYLPSDLAKLAAFFADGTGVVAGKSVVSAGELKAALGGVPGDLGLRAAGDDLRYNNGVWAWNIGGYMKCREATWVPFLSGFGGISVTFPAKNTSYYYVSDGGEFRWARGAAELDKAHSFCRR